MDLRARAMERLWVALVLSGLIIAVLIPVAAFGWLGLGAVVATHEIAEIVIIGNGLSARRRPPPCEQPRDHAGTRGRCMPEPTRGRAPAELAQLIDDAIDAARTGNDPWPALERAHIASSRGHGRTHVFTRRCSASPGANETGLRSSAS